MTLSYFLYWIFLPICNACLCSVFVLLYLIKKQKELLLYCVFIGAYLLSVLFSLYYRVCVGTSEYPHLPDTIRLCIVDSVAILAFTSIVYKQITFLSKKIKVHTLILIPVFVIASHIIPLSSSVKPIFRPFIYVYIWSIIILFKQPERSKEAFHLLIISLLFCFSYIIFLLVNYNIIKLGIYKYFKQIIRIYMCIGKIFLTISPSATVTITPIAAAQEKIVSPFTESPCCSNCQHLEASEAKLSDFGLTAREYEVMSLVSKGKSNRDISDELFLSENTVKRHLHNTYKKLGVANRTQAAMVFKKISNNSKNIPTL